MKKGKKKLSRSMISFNKVLFLLAKDLKEVSNLSRKQIIEQLDYHLTILKVLNMDHIKKAIDEGKCDIEFPEES